MDLVPRSSIGKFGLPIPLDGDGYIDQRHLKDLYATMETVSGDLTIEVNQTKEYFLTGYDAFSIYDVRAINGTVSIDRNVITYTAPGGPGQGQIRSLSISRTTFWTHPKRLVFKLMFWLVWGCSSRGRWALKLSEG